MPSNDKKIKSEVVDSGQCIGMCVQEQLSSSLVYKMFLYRGLNTHTNILIMLQSMSMCALNRTRIAVCAHKIWRV